MGITGASGEAARRSRVSLALVVAALSVLAWCAVSHRWMSDDGFIYLRVVRNVRAGHGPVSTPVSGWRRRPARCGSSSWRSPTS